MFYDNFNFKNNLFLKLCRQIVAFVSLITSTEIGQTGTAKRILKSLLSTKGQKRNRGARKMNLFTYMLEL
jgi:hypothetical protein